MKITYSPNFYKSLSKFSNSIRIKFEKQVNYLVEDICHPSLHAKKFHESSDIWQARVDKDIRFYFSIDGDTYNLLEIRKHPK